MNTVPLSLTDFVDFVVSSGTPKLTKVKTVKERGDYHPAYDFWKALRDGIIEFHRNNRTDKNELDNILVTINDAKKLSRYPEYIRAYKKFLGRKRMQWFHPPSASWGPSGIEIRVNPELGLRINGELYVIKLYFKSDRLSKQRTAIILKLMQTALAPCFQTEVRYGLLDVGHAKLHDDPPLDDTLLALLEGEATSFLTVWNRL